MLSFLITLSQQSSAQKAIEQLNLSFNLSLPLPALYENDDDFDPTLPSEAPPLSVDIVRPNESDQFSLLDILRFPGAAIPYLPIVLEKSRRQNFDPELVLAIIKRESAFNPKAKSSVGAMGLMQIISNTAKWLGLKNILKLYDPTTNIRYGIKYLRYLFSQFSKKDFSSLSKDDIEDQSIKKSIATYNAGPGNVKKYDFHPYYGIPPFKETRA